MLQIQRSGTLNAFLIYFRLHCDEDDANTYSSGPDNPTLVAWDQNTRYLPVEMRVTAGQSLLVEAQHDASMVALGLPSMSPDMLTDIGHVELIRRDHPHGPGPAR